ncbi:MAG: PHP domain-containing protein [Oscillospiraceae bacterium]|nr:PHP domain-containing protein [Oscillospiraceae bacterium]
MKYQGGGEAMNADLHCHTTLSDGSLGIQELLEQAKRNKLDCIAITDHDTLSSLSRATILGKRLGVEVIPAVELSAYDSSRGNKAHILCYNPQNPDRLEGLCLRTSDERKKRGKALANKVIERYPTIAFDNILKYATGSKIIYKSHIMHALMDYGYATELYGDTYRELFDYKHGLCAEIVCNEIEQCPEVKFVTRLVRSAGGVAVLAHPNVYDNFDLLEELAESGMIDGVEAYHSSVFMREGVSEDDKQAMLARMLAVARKHDLIVTGGSDFHGFYNHYPIPPGAYTTDAANVARIKGKKRAKINANV